MSTINTIAAGDTITSSRTVINTNFDNLNTDKFEIDDIDTDTTLAANSDTKVASQKAVKAYVDAGGNPNASTTEKGISEEATTQAELTAGTQTGATGARLFLNPVHTVATSAGAADEGKIPRLNASGRLDSSIGISSFSMQDIDLSVGTTSSSGDFMTATDTTGSVLFFCTLASTTVSIYRLEKDTLTQVYKVTHSTTLSVNSGGLLGAGVAGNYLYIYCNVAGVGAIRRYDKATLANVTSMTISGTNDILSNFVVFSDGTDLYQYNGTTNFEKWTISGTTATNTGTLTSFTSVSAPKGAACDGTNVWITNDNGSGSFTIRKYALSGGASVSSSSAIFQRTAFTNTSTGYGNLFLGGNNVLCVCWPYNRTSDTAIIATVVHIIPISLP